MKAVVVAFAMVLAALPPPAAAQAPASPSEQLQAIAALRAAVYAAAPPPEAEARTAAATLLVTLRRTAADFRGEQLALAYVHLAVITDRIGGLRSEDLLSEVEGLLQRRLGPPHGASQLLRHRTQRSFGAGNRPSNADDWDAMWRRFTGAKRLWLAIEAARARINWHHQPAAADALLTEVLAELDAVPEWDHERAAVAFDEDVYLSCRDRPRAGSRDDARGQMLLLRGFARLRTGRLLAAIADLEVARAHLERSANQHRLVNCDHNLAHIWLELGRHDLAIATAARAERMYAQGIGFGDRSTDRVVDDNGVRTMQKVRAQALARRGRPGDLERAEIAFAAWVESVAGVDVGETNVDGPCSHAELLLRLPPSAERWAMFDRVLALVRRHCGEHRVQTASVHAELLRAEGALRRERPDVARRILTAERERLELLGHRGLRVRWWTVSGHVELADGDVGAAWTCFERAAAALREIVLVEELWRLDGAAAACVAQFAAVLDGAHAAARRDGSATACARLYDLVQQFHGFETLCRTLQVQGGGAAAADRSDDPQRERLEQSLAAARAEHARLLRRRVQSPRGDRLLAASVRELERAELALRASSAADAARLEARGLVARSLADVQASLQADELLLECVETDAAAFCLVVERDRCALQPLPQDADWHAAVAAFVGWADGDGDDGDPQVLQRLAARLLPHDGWLAERLRRGDLTRVSWSPEGSFGAVPFAALPLDGRPLVARLTIGHGISGSALVHARRRPARPTRPLRLLAVGNPRYPAASATQLVRSSWLGGGLPSLPATAAEVVGIAHWFATPPERERLAELAAPQSIDGEVVGERYHLLLGTAARESALPPLAANADVLHFACHAEMPADTPALAMLALSLDDEPGPDPDAGLLRLAELAQLRGDYALAVLSACRSAGRGAAHEGSAGLAWAAQLAGARSVLATLWSVPDVATAAFVRDVYDRWLGRGLSPAAALAAAQREAAAGGDVPMRVWAAFVCWGEGR